MTMSVENLAEKVREFYQLALTDFPKAVEKYVGEGFTWENPLPDHIPFGGVYHGADGLWAYLTGLSAAIEMGPLEWDDIVCEGNIAVCIGVEADTLVKATAKRYTMPCVHVLRFNDDGKIVHVREYNDTKEMIEAFR